MVYLYVVLSAILVVWVFTCFRRKLPSTEKIIKRIRPIKHVKGRVRSNPIKDLLETDQMFWKTSDGFEGLLLRNNNAVCYVQLCQRLEKDHGMPKTALRFISRRAFWIKFLVVCAYPEQFVRLIFKNLPHLCARGVHHLYDELTDRADGLIAHYGPNNWIIYG